MIYILDTRLQRDHCPLYYLLNVGKYLTWATCSSLNVIKVLFCIYGLSLVCQSCVNDAISSSINQCHIAIGQETFQQIFHFLTLHDREGHCHRGPELYILYRLGMRVGIWLHSFISVYSGDGNVQWLNGCMFVFVQEGGDGDVQWLNGCMFVFVEPGVQAVQEGGDGDVPMTAVNGDITDGASGGKDEEMEEGESHKQNHGFIWARKKNPMVLSEDIEQNHGFIWARRTKPWFYPNSSNKTIIIWACQIKPWINWMYCHSNN